MHTPASNPLTRRAGRVAATYIGVAIALLSARADASDGARMASEYGCLNCHASQPGFAPSLQQLAERIARENDRPDAQQAMLHELREHTGIHSHQMVSDAPALAILKWLAQGAK